MSFKPLSTSNSDEANWGQATDMLREIYSRETTEVYKDDTGTRRVLIGKGADGFNGIRVSKAGVDVYTASSQDLLLDSDSPSIFNSVTEGTLVIPTLVISAPGAGNYSSSVASAQVAHGLGYVPGVFAFALSGGSYFPLPFSETFGSGTAGRWLSLTVGTDGTNVYGNLQVCITGGTGYNAGGTTTVKYFLLQEAAN